MVDDIAPFVNDPLNKVGIIVSIVTGDKYTSGYSLFYYEAS